MQSTPTFTKAVSTLRIALVLGKLDPARGGAESWSYQLGEWLRARNHEVHFLATSAAANLAIPPERIHLVKKGRHCLQTADRFARWLESESFDIVHDMGVGYRFDILQPHFGSLIAHDRARDATSSVWRNLCRSAKSLLFGGPDYQLAKRQYENRDGTILAVSPKVAHDIQEFHHVAAERIATIPNGVDHRRFRPDRRRELRGATRENLGLQPEDKTLLMVAHNFNLKGVPFVLKTLRQMSLSEVRYHLLVVGGKRKQNWRAVGEHQVKYIGSVGDVLPYFAAADVYLHPTYYDACSLSLLEAMACGLPTITTPANGASCFIQHGFNGMILPRHNSAALCEQLRSLNNESNAQPMGHAARQSAAGWTLQDNFQAVEQLYESIANRWMPQSSPLTQIA